MARVVFDLKSAVKPYVFPLAPAGDYRHRLVLDLYPEKPRDPLLALVQPGPDPIGEIANAPVLELGPGGARRTAKPAAPELPVVKPDPGKPSAARPADKGKARPGSSSAW